MFSQTFIQELAIKTNLPESEVHDILKAFWETFKNAVLDGEKVHIPGLGMFEIRHLNSLKEMDESTGQSILTPPKDTLEFTPEQ
jgi:nucleoid DNA-binding protein